MSSIGSSVLLAPCFAELGCTILRVCVCGGGGPKNSIFQIVCVPVQFIRHFCRLLRWWYISCSLLCSDNETSTDYDTDLDLNAKAFIDQEGSRIYNGIVTTKAGEALVPSPSLGLTVV